MGPSTRTVSTSSILGLYPSPHLQWLPSWQHENLLLVLAQSLLCIHPFQFKHPGWPLLLKFSCVHSLLFSHSVVSDSFWPHGLQHARLPFSSLSPRVCSNSCPLSWWSHPNLILHCPLLLLPSIFPIIRVFCNPYVKCVHHCEAHSFFLSGYEVLEDINQVYGSGQTSCFTVYVEGWRWIGKKKEKKNIKHTLKIQNNQFLVCVCQILKVKVKSLSSEPPGKPVKYWAVSNIISQKLSIISNNSNESYFTKKETNSRSK